MSHIRESFKKDFGNSISIVARKLILLYNKSDHKKLDSSFQTGFCPIVLSFRSIKLEAKIHK